MRAAARGRRTPLFWVTGGLLVGQGAATVLAGPLVEWLLVSGALLALVEWWRGRAAATTGAIAMAFLAAAVGHWQLDRRLRPSFPPDHVQRLDGVRLVLRGCIAERPAPRPAATQFVLEAAAVRRGAEWQPAEGRVLVTVRDATQPWQRGDGVEALLALRRPRNFGNPGEFDYEAFLARRRLYATAFAASDAGWRRWPRADGPALAIERWRDAVARTIAGTLEPTAAKIVAALLLGEAGALPSELRDRYARTGLSHVLVIAGLHLGLLAAAGYAVARWLLARSERALLHASVPKLAMAATLGPLGLYAALASAGVATLRAEVVSVLVVGAVLLDRPRDWLAALAAAALAISLYRPGAMFEIGFQLSFVAVLAIVVGMRRITAWWNEWEEARLIRLRGRGWRWVRWLALSFAATLCAMLGTAPLLARYFNQVSLIAPLANLLVVPLLGFISVGAGLLATAAVAIAPTAAPPLFAGVGRVVRIADAMVRLCAAVPGSSVRVVTPSLLELALGYGALGALLVPRRALRRRVLILCLTGLAADAAYWLEQRTARGALQVTFVSVGQGDCAVIEFPGAAVMVVDGGGLSGEFDVGRQVVAPFLWRRKIAHVDTLVLSHPDFDHFGGLGFLAGAFAPQAFWWNGEPGSGTRFTALWRALRAADVPMHTLSRGFAQTIDGVDVRVLHPPADGGGSDNNRSLTVQLRYGPTTVLLPGDLEADGERALVAASGPALRSTVLKVPHHGSRSSSSAALLDAVAPRLAVISVGADNRFAFPQPAVLDAYRRRGIALWRTDRDGAVSLRITAAGAITVTTGRAAPRSATP
jgi:competence protein ComEC